MLTSPLRMVVLTAVLAADGDELWEIGLRSCLSTGYAGFARRARHTPALERV